MRQQLANTVVNSIHCSALRPAASNLSSVPGSTLPWLVMRDISRAACTRWPVRQPGPGGSSPRRRLGACSLLDEARASPAQGSQHIHCPFPVDSRSPPAPIARAPSAGTLRSDTAHCAWPYRSSYVGTRWSADRSAHVQVRRWHLHSGAGGGAEASSRFLVGSQVISNGRLITAAGVVRQAMSAIELSCLSTVVGRSGFELA